MQCILAFIADGQAQQSVNSHFPGWFIYAIPIASRKKA
jgi:hypothetical protein